MESNIVISVLWAKISMVACTSLTHCFVPLYKMGLKTSVLMSSSVGLVVVLHQNILDANSFYLCRVWILKISSWIGTLFLHGFKNEIWTDCLWHLGNMKIWKRNHWNKSSEQMLAV